MHPIEHLRYVARATGAPQRALADETADALAGFARDELGLVTACRRLAHRHPAAGSVVWLCATALTAVDPISALRRAADEVTTDPTGAHLSGALPLDGRLVVVGWPETTVLRLRQRGDVDVVVVDVDGGGRELVRALGAADLAAWPVPLEAIGAALREADVGQEIVVALEADAVGPTTALCTPGSLPVAATARALGVPVWLVAPRGRTQPPEVFDAVVAKLGRDADDDDHGFDLVPLDLVDTFVGPEGVEYDAASWRARLATPECPLVPELFAGDVF